jgi:flagellar biosynthetic protein FlhB
MASGGGQEKTEKATSKKRRDARMKEGNVLQSKDVSATVSLLITFCTLFLIGRYMFTMLQRTVTESIERVGEEHTINDEFLLEIFVLGLEKWFLILFPLLALAIVVPVLIGVIQTKGLFTMKPLKPKFSKLNPITGMKRFFSMQTAVNIVKSVIVIFIIAVLIYNRIGGNIDDYKRMLDMDLLQCVRYMARESFFIVMMILMVMVFVSAADYLFQWYQYEKKLKMSKQEVKDEYKQVEGDPQIKSKIKAKQREVAQQRMMEKVPTSDVIIRNPTHYAVALSYDKENTVVAPTVVAKGKGALALKIIEIGEANDVFISENRPLARELYDTVEVGWEIPPSLYNAIAVVLTDMYTHKGITLDK